MKRSLAKKVYLNSGGPLNTTEGMRLLAEKEKKKQEKEEGSRVWRMRRELAQQRRDAKGAAAALKTQQGPKIQGQLKIE